MAQTSGWRGDEFAAETQQGAAIGLTKAAERLRAVSVPRAPVADGPLRGSAQVHTASVGNLEAGVSYDTVYAVIQHERTDFHHSEGEAKYLERPLSEHGAELQAIIATEIRRHAGG